MATLYQCTACNNTCVGEDVLPYGTKCIRCGEPVAWLTALRSVNVAIGHKEVSKHTRKKVKRGDTKEARS
jgi:hypothetical protein